MARSLSNLAFVLLAEGRPREAEPFAREALDHDAGAVVAGPYSCAISRSPGGSGEGREAEPPAREALWQSFEMSEACPWRTPDAESVLGSCLAAQGRFAEAEPLLLGSYPILKADAGEGARYAPAALAAHREPL